MTISTSYDHRRSNPPARARCTVAGCGGDVLRHSLGCGIATRRCTRCFKRYSDSEVHILQLNHTSSARRPLSRFLHELLTWREED